MATAKGQDTYWRNWTGNVRPLGVDPFLYKTRYQLEIRCLIGFGARARSGYYGRGKQVQAATDAGAISAVGPLAMDSSGTPHGSVRCWKPWPRTKEVPPTIKKLPVAIDVPKFLADEGRQQGVSELMPLVGDMSLIEFYFLLRVGEYTVKGSRNDSK